jgi:hypothetical protein
VCAVPLFPLVPLLSRGRAVLLDVRGETITLYIAHKIFLQLYSLIKGLLGLESLAVTGLAERDHRQGENTPVSWRSTAAHCVYGPSGTPSMSRVR